MTDLTVIVPVLNAGPLLGELTSAILSVPCIETEIIFVDDGSTDDTQAVLAKLRAFYRNITILTQPATLGAGLARNLGWAQASGEFTMFFDADDIFHWAEIAPALAMFRSDDEIDLVVFSYILERSDMPFSLPMTPGDRRVFSSLLGGQSERIGTLDDLSDLLLTTNYPWNKIMRTARYKPGRFQFGSTRVNNDILGHWLAIMDARRLGVTSRVIGTHILHPGGANLTNQNGEVRLQLFDALTELRAAIVGQGCDDLFWRFAVAISRWARGNLPPSLSVLCDQRMADLVSNISPEELVAVRLSDRQTARQIDELFRQQVCD